MIARPLLALGLLAGTAVGQVQFPFARTDYPGGLDPSAVAAGLVDGDAFPDLVYAALGTGEVYVRLNQGDGTFAAPLTVGSLAGASGVALGHVDGDGLLDLAVLSDAQDLVALFLGRGDGTFAEAGTVALSGNLVHLVLADLTADGFDELLVSDATFDTSRILIAENEAGAGGDTYAAPLVLSVVDPAANFAVGDLDGNGDPDLVVAGEQGSLGHSFLAEPGLAFTEVGFLPSSFGGDPTWVELADVDGDGLLDLIATEDDFFSVDMLVWRGDGDGTFSTKLYESLLGGLPTFTRAGDFNGDGAVDFVVRWGAQDVRGFGNDGDGFYWVSPVEDTGPAVTALAVADLDGDGDDDVVTTNAGSDRLSVLLAEPQTLSSYNNTITAQSNFPKTHQMALQIGPEHAGELYWVLGSAAGTSPGLPVGPFTLPLNFDGYTQFTLLNPNTLILSSLGFLNAAGAGDATWSLPSFTPLDVAGLTLNHAFVVLDFPSLTPTFVSAALTLKFT